MNSKVPPGWAVIILGVIGIAFSAIIIFFLAFAMPNPNSYGELALLTGNQSSQNTQPAAPPLPIRLEIPKINIDAVLEYVGLTPQGAMAVTKGPTNAAWFYLGPRPGEDGAAVIAGHDGWKDGIPAVFDNLYKLKKGDKVYIKDENGSTTTFIVRTTQTFGQNADASAVFISSDGKAHLNLITCEGTWNPVKQSYSNRLVVFTDKV
jgi:LPXTG-site transpeptidase (sortase) family protein